MSDDVNGLLVQLVIVLALGRFISVSLVDAIVLLTRGQLPQERFVENAQK